MIEFIKKNYIVIIVCIFIVVCSVCFGIAYINRDTNSNSTSITNNSASSISADYTNIDYGESSELVGEEITSGGSYDITGEHSTIIIDTTDNVELKLDNATINGENGPAIYVVSAKNVSIVLSGENTITSNTTEDLDGAIYSKSDLIFSGDGTLNITSNYDGIVSKDTLLINSGTYNITSQDDGIRGKDNVVIVDGVFNINSVSDGIKSSNDEDSSKGYIVIDNGTFNIKTTGNTSDGSSKGIKAVTSLEINGGTYTLNTVDDSIHCDGDISISGGAFNINSRDDGIHADGLVQISGGNISISASEGIEGTYVKIDNGTINISASDDGINATNKSNKYSVLVEINGGDITIKMGQGDTDGVDSNGNITINGGTIRVTGQSTFDYDGTGTINGGTVICNGEEVSTLPNQVMGGGPGGQGGPGGRR